MKLTPLLLLALSCTLLSGCAQKYQKAFKQNVAQMQQTLQRDVSNDQAIQKKAFNRLPISIQQTLADYDAKLTTDGKKHFNIAADDLSINTFLQAFAHSAKINMVIDPNISGRLSLHLRHATTSSIFAVLNRIYGIDIYQKGHLYIATPMQIHTEIFHLNYLDVIQQGTSEMSIAGTDSTGGQASTAGNSTSLKTTFSTADFWKNLESSINELIGTSHNSDAKVTIDPLSGIIVVKAYPKALEAVGKFLKEIQQYSQEQVIIQAQILDVDLSTSLNTAFHLSSPHFDITTDTANNAYTYKSKGLTNDLVNPEGGFGAIVNLLENYGQVSILSSPQISTLNNQKALIKVGDVSYHITSLSSSSTPTGSTSTQTQDYNFQPFFSGIALDVTPQISFDHEVILHIHPVITTVTDDNQSFVVDSGANDNLPFASTSIREMDSIVRAKSGQIIIIGGLMENQANNDDSGLPGIGQQLATGHKDTDAKQNLVILLKPIVVGNDGNWNTVLKKANASFLKNLKGA